MFQDYYQLYKLKELINARHGLVCSHPHNTFFAFFIQNGMIGGIGFLLLLFWYVKGVFEIFKSEQKIRRIIRRVFSLFLVHGMADTLYWKMTYH